MNVPAAFEKITLLAQLPKDRRQILVPFCATRRMRAGDVLFQQGDPSPECYGVISGEILIRQISRDNRFPPKLLGRLGPGELFGEFSLFDDRPRTAMAMASADTELLIIKGQPWRNWLATHAEAGMPIVLGLLQGSLERLGKTNQELGLIYGTGRILAEDKPLAVKALEALYFLKGTVADVESAAFYQRSLFWPEYQRVAATAEAAPVLEASCALVTQICDWREAGVLSEERGAQTAVVPCVLVEPVSSGLSTLAGFLILTASRNASAFSGSTLLALTSVGEQFADSLSRQTRGDEVAALQRLHQSRL